MTPITLSRQRHGFLADCLADRAEPVARSARFTIYPLDPSRNDIVVPHPNDIIVVHDFAPSEIDNNIGHHVADELLPLLTAALPGGTTDDDAVSEQEMFERFVGEIVRSIDGDERRAWRLFYDNTLAALARAGRREGGADRETSPPQDFITDFAAIYRRVADLVAEAAPATVLDAATCFGFLPMLLAAGAGTDGVGAGRRRIVACDLNAALVSLAADYARHRRLAGVSFVQADILAADLAAALAATSPFDVVTAIHLLEHLEPEETGPAVQALWALAGLRLIVTVPMERVPDPRFGHRQVFDCERLRAIGERTGGTCRCFEDHGAWLVIDRARNEATEAARERRPHGL